MYEFEKDVSLEEREFFGYNEGTPETYPKSGGMLNAQSNVMSFTCSDVNKTVPYFREFNRESYPGFTSMNDYMYDKLSILADANMSFN